MILDLRAFIEILLKKLDEAQAADDRPEMIQLLQILSVECDRQIAKIKEAG